MNDDSIAKLACLWTTLLDREIDSDLAARMLAMYAIAASDTALLSQITAYLRDFR